MPEEQLRGRSGSDGAYVPTHLLATSQPAPLYRNDSIDIGAQEDAALQAAIERIAAGQRQPG